MKALRVLGLLLLACGGGVPCQEGETVCAGTCLAPGEVCCDNKETFCMAGTYCGFNNACVPEGYVQCIDFATNTACPSDKGCSKTAGQCNP